MMQGNGQGQPKGKEPVEVVMDLLVHLPIGFAVMAWKRVPEFVGSVPELVGQAVAKGCAQLAGAEERLSEEMRKARMIGQVAVTFGGRQLRREVDARLRDARQAAGGVASAGAPTVRATPTAPVSPPDTAAKPSRASKAAAKPAAAAKSTAKPAGARTATKAPAKKASAKKASAATKQARRDAPPASAADLPIREYDGLSASQVVSRLTGLTPEELRAIRSYEEGSRGRRTVLVAIDRLLA
jgi:hypothetical protein